MGRVKRAEDRAEGVGCQPVTGSMRLSEALISTDKNPGRTLAQAHERVAAEPRLGTRCAKVTNQEVLLMTRVLEISKAEAGLQTRGFLVFRIPEIPLFTLTQPLETQPETRGND